MPYSFLSVTAFILLFTQTIQAQGVSLRSQADVDAFHKSTTLINGSLIISGDDIVDLSNLSNLEQINGSLTIRGNKLLTNIDSLSSLTMVSNGIWIEDNNALTNVDGLSSVNTCRNLSIEENPALKSLDGFNQISSIRGSLVISLCDALESINSFNNLTHVEGQCQISINRELQSINGFNKITSLSDDLWISANDKLTSITAFSELTSVKQHFGIDNHYELLELNGFPSLDSVYGFFAIRSNDILNTVHGFGNLSYIGSHLKVHNNEELSNCCFIQNLLDQQNSIGGDIEIYSNNFGCNTIEDVLETECASSISTAHSERDTYLSVFPTRATTSLTIQLPNGVQFDQIEILDHMGRMITQLAHPSSPTEFMVISIQGLQDGVYIVRANSSDGYSLSNRFIKNTP